MHENNVRQQLHLEQLLEVQTLMNYTNSLLSYTAPLFPRPETSLISEFQNRSASGDGQASLVGLGLVQAILVPPSNRLGDCWLGFESVDAALVVALGAVRCGSRGWPLPKMSHTSASAAGMAQHVFCSGLLAASTEAHSGCVEGFTAGVPGLDVVLRLAIEENVEAQEFRHLQ